MNVLRSLVGPTLQALKRMDLNKWHRLIAMDIVDGTLALGRQFLVVRFQRDLCPKRDFKEGELSQVLNGYERDGHWFRGLIEMGLIVRRELPQGWLFEFNPNWKAWQCREMHLVVDREAWRAAVDAQSREYERQSLMGEIEERFSLTTLLSAGNVEAALALARGDVVAAAGSGPMMVKQGGPAVGRISCKADAPESSRRRDERSRDGVTSENPKCIPEQRRGEFGKPEVPRARVQVGKKDLGKAVQVGVVQFGELERSRREVLKGRLHGSEVEFMWAVEQMLGRCSDGLRWRLRHREGGQHRSTARAVWADLLTSDRPTTVTMASRAEHTWSDFGGKKLDVLRFQKKSKESLIKPMVAR